MTRRRGSFPCGTIVLGLALMPVVFAVAFFGLVLAAEAMGVGSLSQLERAVQDLLVYTGLVSAPATPTPAPVDLDPSPTPFQPLLTETLETSDSPTASPSATTTPSATLTLTTTPTETMTATASLTLSPTVTPSATIVATATRTRTPTQPPTRTVTRTLPPPTASNTPEVQPEPTATSDGQPTQAPDTATPTTAPTVSTCAAAANSSVEAQVVTLVNDERVSQGLAAYSVDSRLRRRRACTPPTWPAITSLHTPGRTARRCVIGSSGKDTHGPGSAKTTTSGGSGAETAFDWWMNSTLHRANLLSPNYTQFGVGYVYDADSDYGGYFVVVFARPG